MKRLVWVTDIHLNFVSGERLAQLMCDIQQQNPDAVLIGGDIAEAPTLSDTLRRLSHRMPCPVYYVLGNHDYYRGSITDVHATAREVSQSIPNFTWLDDAGVVGVGERTALVGHGGWGDGRAESFLRSTVMLNDYVLIRELSEISMRAGAREPRSRSMPVLSRELLGKLQALGDEAAAHFDRVLPEALQEFENVLVLMHVPPFRESAWHEGKVSDNNWAPHFTCLAAGDSLRRWMLLYPHRRMTVLCGHTHGPGQARILENLVVFTGGAIYGEPAVQRVLEVD